MFIFIGLEVALLCRRKLRVLISLDTDEDIQIVDMAVEKNQFIMSNYNFKKKYMYKCISCPKSDFPKKKGLRVRR